VMSSGGKNSELRHVLYRDFNLTVTETAIKKSEQNE
jgi:hypothetical protein